MKYWNKESYADGSYICLESGSTEDIVEITNTDGVFLFESGWNPGGRVYYTKEQAIEALQEAIEWIENES